MDFKVLITDSAIADLKTIVEFIAEDDQNAATRVGEKLINHALNLSTMPERFPLHDRTRGIRKMSAAPFLMFYTIDQTKSLVNILHFWHGARQSPRFSNA
ncbi:MAG: type II toxin-antitoxin system RelE/ParE family toxin [Chthoniobacterales bacterium]